MSTQDVINSASDQYIEFKMLGLNCRSAIARYNNPEVMRVSSKEVLLLDIMSIGVSLIGFASFKSASLAYNLIGENNIAAATSATIAILTAYFPAAFIYTMSALDAEYIHDIAVFNFDAATCIGQHIFSISDSSLAS